MCGITGFWKTRGSVAGAVTLASDVEAMADAIRHRGPDDSGVFVSEADGIAFGFRRLAIVDLSSAGHQPMKSHSGRYVGMLNGEIYNFEELRAELPSIPYRGHSDTEVLLAAFDHWGIEATLKRCNGMFAIAVWDQQEKQLTLARDRFGEKPLHYAFDRGRLSFASELKALRAMPGYTPQLDQDALLLYLRYNAVPAPWTIYKDCFKLRPGHFIQFRQADIESRPASVPYWEARSVVEQGLANPLSNEADVLQQLETALKRSVRLRMVADVPLGSFLSGGIDSSTAVALMQAQSSRPIQTYSIGFHEYQFDEAQHAARVAQHLKTSHTEFYVTGRDALDVVPELPKIYDEPFADSSQIPTLLISRLARQHVTVAVTGDGGDEVFGGYNRYLWHGRVWKTATALPGWMRGGIAGSIGVLSPSAWDKLSRPLFPLLPGRLRHSNIGEKLYKLRMMFRSDSPMELYSMVLSIWQDPASLLLGERREADVGIEWLAKGAAPESMMYFDARQYLPDDILAKVDRASMAASLETRTPYLDHDVFALAWRIPLAMKIQNGRGKMVLRKILQKYLPEELFERSKMGFGVPLAEWLRGPLRDYAEALLAEKRLREQGIFDAPVIRWAWQQHLAGKGSWHYQIWNILMFQAWMDEAKPGSVPQPTESPSKMMRS